MKITQVSLQTRANDWYHSTGSKCYHKIPVVHFRIQSVLVWPNDNIQLCKSKTTSSIRRGALATGNLRGNHRKMARGLKSLSYNITNGKTNKCGKIFKVKLI